MSNKKAIDAISKYIADSLNSPEARRTRMLAVLSNRNPVLKVKWAKPKKGRYDQHN